MKFSFDPSLIARFLMGTTWGLIYADSLINCRANPLLAVGTTFITVGFAGLSGLIQLEDSK